MKQEFIMMCGTPGSGKSDIAKELIEHMHNPASDDCCCLVSTDDIREKFDKNGIIGYNQQEVFDIATSEIVKALQSGSSVVYDANNSSRQNRKNILKVVKKFCIPTVAVVTYRPLDEAWEKVKTKSNKIKYKNLMYQFKNFEPPFYTEGFDSIYFFKK